MIKGCMSGPGMQRCGCHAPTLFSGKLSTQVPCLPWRIWLPRTWAFSARSMHRLACPKRVVDSAVRHSGTSSGNPHQACLVSLVLQLLLLPGGHMGCITSASQCGFAQGSHRNPLLSSKYFGELVHQSELRPLFKKCYKD